MSLSTKVLQTLIHESLKDLQISQQVEKFLITPSTLGGDNFYKEMKELSSSIFLDERLSDEKIIHYRKFFTLMQSSIRNRDTKDLEAFDFEKLPYNLSLSVLNDDVLFVGKHLWPKEAKIKQFQKDFLAKESVTEEEISAFLMTQKEMKESMNAHYSHQCYLQDTAIHRYRQENGFC